MCSCMYVWHAKVTFYQMFDGIFDLFWVLMSWFMNTCQKGTWILKCIVSDGDKRFRTIFGTKVPRRSAAHGITTTVCVKDIIPTCPGVRTGPPRLLHVCSGRVREHSAHQVCQYTEGTCCKYVCVHVIMHTRARAASHHAHTRVWPARHGRTPRGPAEHGEV